MQVHKENIEKVPNSIKGRDNITLEICGMDNIPKEDLIEHEKQKYLYAASGGTLDSDEEENAGGSDHDTYSKSPVASMSSQPPPPLPPAPPSSLLPPLPPPPPSHSSSTASSLQPPLPLSKNDMASMPMMPSSMGKLN